MIKLTPVYEQTQQFVLTADEPVSIEVHVTNGCVVAHVYRGTDPDEHTAPIGAYDGTFTNNQAWEVASEWPLLASKMKDDPDFVERFTKLLSERSDAVIALGLDALFSRLTALMDDPELEVFAPTLAEASKRLRRSLVNELRELGDGG